MDTSSPGIGHNSGVIGPEELRELLSETHGGLLSRKDELLAGTARVPAELDDETARKLADFIKQLQTFIKNADSARVSAKEPFLAGGRAVDGYFKALTDPVEGAKKGLERGLTTFQQAKAAEERRKREAEAAVAAAEARHREEEERAAAAERRRQEEEAARALAGAKTEADLAAAIKADEARKLALIEEEERRKVAEMARAEEEHRRRNAEAKAADLTKERGDLGAVASLRTVWTFAELDRDALALEPLRAHIPTAALETAIRSYIKAGARELKGVRIFEETTSVVR